MKSKEIMEKGLHISTCIKCTGKCLYYMSNSLLVYSRKRLFVLKLHVAVANLQGCVVFTFEGRQKHLAKILWLCSKAISFFASIAQMYSILENLHTYLHICVSVLSYVSITLFVDPNMKCSSFR